jgi:hypothetical protein
MLFWASFHSARVASAVSFAFVSGSSLPRLFWLVVHREELCSDDFPFSKLVDFTEILRELLWIAFGFGVIHEKELEWD